MSSIMKGLVDETEAKKGADGKRCWKGKRYAGTENGKDKCIPVKNEAANPAQQAAIAISKKERGEKPKNEGVIIGHDKDDPQVAVLGGAGSYKLSNLKKKALGEAKQLAADIANGEYKNSAYNVKQLANTLNTIVAAEEEMEKAYFGENLKEGWLEGAGAGFLIGLGTGHPTLGTVLGAALGAFITAVAKAKGVNAAKENPKYYIFINGKQHDNEERSAWDAATVIADLAAKEQDIKTQFTIADAKTGTVVFRKYWEPEKEEGFMSSHKPAGWKDQWHDDDIKEDYTGEFAAEKTPETNPYGGQRDRQHRGAISETPTDNPTGASGEGGWRKYKPKPAGELEEACWKGYHKEGNKKMFGKTYPNCVKNTNEEQVDEREMSPELKAAQQNLIAIRNKQKAVNIPSKKERIAKDKVEIDKPKPASIFTKGSQETDPDTMDAIAAFLAKGGEIKKGRPGKAPPVGRSLASKHIGGAGSFKRKGDRPGLGANYRGDKIVQVEEEQLDEKCWDSHKQVGMKNKGGKQVPNCVPKESAIMKGLSK